MNVKFTVHGLTDTINALGELPRSTQRNVLMRTLRKAAQPMVESAEAKLPSPGKTGKGHLRRQGIRVTNIPPKGADAGKEAFAATLQAGGTRAEAGAALREARKASPNAFARIFVGPSRDPAAMMQEFGTARHPPQPYLRPAYDAKKDAAMRIIGADLGSEVEKTAARRARRLAKRAAKG